MAENYLGKLRGNKFRLILSSFFYTEKRGLWRQKSTGEFTQGQGISGIANAELENVHISCTTERENQHLPCLWLTENPGHHQLQLQEGGVYLRRYREEYKLQSKLMWYNSSKEPLPTLCSKGRKKPKNMTKPKKESHCSSSYIAFCY